MNLLLGRGKVHQKVLIPLWIPKSRLAGKEEGNKHDSFSGSTC